MKLSSPTSQTKSVRVLKPLGFLAVSGLVLSLAFAASSPRFQPPAPEGDKVGRFAVLPARVDNEDNFIRIDTCTGRTWTLIRVPVTLGGQAGHVRGWQPVDEDPLFDLRQPALPAATSPLPTLLDHDPALKAAGLVK